MSFSNGPKGIVTDGLVFAIDGGNPQSWISEAATCYDIIRGSTGAVDNNIDYSSSFGGYMYMDGTDTEIALGVQTAGQWSSDPCTFEFVARKTTLSSGILYMDRTDWKGTEGVEMFFYDFGGDLTFEARGAGNLTSSPAVSSSPLSIDVWYHLVGVFNGTDGKIYINGVEDGTETIFSINDSTGNSYIGVYGSGTISRFVGDLGLMRIYHKALSATEIKQNFNSLKPRFGL